MRARASMAVFAALLVAVVAGDVRAQLADYFTLPNGQRVRASDPAGGRGKVNSDGSVSYPDGTTVGVGAGDATVVQRADGSRSVSPPPDSFTLPNGQEVRASDPSGRRGKQNADGSITYPDGTRIGMDAKGNTEIAMADGSRRSVDAPPKDPADPRAPSTSPGGGTITLPDGTVVPAHGRDGQPATIMPDGSVRYTDGSRIERGPDGEWRIVSADGREAGLRETQDAFASEGAKIRFDVAEAGAASDRILARAKKIADLELQRDDCPKGRAGQGCRDALAEAIRALKRENRIETQRYLEMVGSPAP